MKKEKKNAKNETDKKEKKKGMGEVDITATEQAATEAEAGTIPVGDGEVELDEVELLQARVAELEVQKLRALADLDNYRKLMARRFQDIVQSANDRLLGNLLNIVDNFERALAHADSDISNGDTEPESFRKGTELIYSQMIEFLAGNEVKAMETVGHSFDPNLHEALMEVPSDEYDEGAIVNEISKGYLMGERVLRHAKVAVSSGHAAKSQEVSSDEE